MNGSPSEITSVTSRQGEDVGNQMQADNNNNKKKKHKTRRHLLLFHAVKLQLLNFLISSQARSKQQIMCVTLEIICLLFFWMKPS